MARVEDSTASAALKQIRSSLSGALEDAMVLREGADPGDGLPAGLVLTLTTAREELRVLAACLAETEAALREIHEAAIAQHDEWMHFHEVGIDDPFRAEREAQAFAKAIAALAVPPSVSPADERTEGKA
jgi:hypothetical protein